MNMGSDSLLLGRQMQRGDELLYEDGTSPRGTLHLPWLDRSAWL